MTASPITQIRSVAKGKRVLCLALAAGVGLGIGFLAASPDAAAQFGNYADGAVTIDLSAIPGGGYAPAPGGGAGAAPVYGGLLDPGVRPPSSIIYVQPQNAPKIRPKTASRTLSEPRMSEPKPRMAPPAPEPAPRPIVEKAPPAPPADKAPEQLGSPHAPPMQTAANEGPPAPPSETARPSKRAAAKSSAPSAPPPPMT
ncbi:MAG: hypothetical protein VW268_13305, partial [Rhodospirillaceae bacterium]